MSRKKMALAVPPIDIDGWVRNPETEIAISLQVEAADGTKNFTHQMPGKCKFIVIKDKDNLLLCRWCSTCIIEKISILSNDDCEGIYV